MNTTHIYTLAHPTTGVIRYVGKANKLGARYALHIRKDEHTAKSRWIQSLKSQGLQPTMEVLDIVPSGEWQFWEMYWIAQLKAWGCTLYNGDNGGLGSDRLSAAIKAQIGDSLRDRPQPEKWVSYAQYDISGNWIATHNSAHAAGASVGSGHSVIVTAAKRQERMKGFLWLRVDGEAPLTIPSRYTSNKRPPLSQEARQRSSERSKGRPGKIPGEATRAKMRAAKLGKSPANKGIPQTAEQKKILSEASTTRKAVCQLGFDGTLIKEWPSIKEAAIATGATRAGILNVIKGKNKHAAGFKWARLIT